MSYAERRRRKTLARARAAELAAVLGGMPDLPGPYNLLSKFRITRHDEDGTELFAYERNLRDDHRPLRRLRQRADRRNP